MNTKTFLRDWKRGDVVTDEDLQAIIDAVTMLEAVAPGGGGGVQPTGGTRRISDGPVEMPWQVYAVTGKYGIELRVIPGEVVVGFGAGEDRELQTATIDAAGVTVQDFEPTEESIVWLELTATVKTSRTKYDGSAATDTYNGRYQAVTLTNPRLRVTCAPADNASRVWALAAWNPAHGQKVTQLTWGDLSALECRGLLDEAGRAVWPQDRCSAAPWTDEGHRGGMATMCAVDVSTEKETIVGTLSGCLDLDGAMELFLGPSKEEELPDPDPDDPDPDTDDPWTDNGEDDSDDDGGDDDDDYNPVHPDPDPDDPDPDDVEPTKVKYGYVAGEGFKSCTLVNNSAGTNLSWKLVIDTAYLVGLLANIKATGNVSFSGGGSSAGVWATVTMSLNSPSASASGVKLTGSTGLAFKGTAGSTGVPSSTVSVTYTASPKWTWSKTEILLSADELHDAGNYVIREKGNYTGNPFVEARHWYRFRVDKNAFKKHAQNYFKSQLSAISVSDSDSSSSSDSTVTGTLSGTILNPSFSLTLS